MKTFCQFTFFSYSRNQTLWLKLLTPLFPLLILFSHWTETSTIIIWTYFLLSHFALYISILELFARSTHCFWNLKNKRYTNIWCKFCWIKLFKCINLKIPIFEPYVNFISPLINMYLNFFITVLSQIYNTLCRLLHINSCLWLGVLPSVYSVQNLI